MILWQISCDDYKVICVGILLTYGGVWFSKKCVYVDGTSQ